MGSVKDLKIISGPSPEQPGRGHFFFSDRYSVFDWGEMPDLIPRKGEAIAVLGAYFFEKLEEQGIPTHYFGLVEESAPRRLQELKEPSAIMEVRLLNVIKPELVDGRYDYAAYRNVHGCFLIPLEVIYRNTLPEGSSVFKRLEEGSITPADLGLAAAPEPGQKLDPPVIDVSTKLEITDRYLSWDEAQEISGLSDAEMEELKSVTRTVNGLISSEFAAVGLTNEDGKIELGFDPERRLMLVDVLGTLDECRFTYDGLPVSKEITRIYYRETPWYHDTEEAKKQDRQRWKEICRSAPEPLPAGLRQLVSGIYCACTNEVTGREWFAGTPPLEETLKKIKGYLKQASRG